MHHLFEKGAKFPQTIEPRFKFQDKVLLRMSIVKFEMMSFNQESVDSFKNVWNQVLSEENEPHSKMESFFLQQRSHLQAKTPAKTA